MCPRNLKQIHRLSRFRVWGLGFRGFGVLGFWAGLGFRVLNRQQQCFKGAGFGMSGFQAGLKGVDGQSARNPTDQQPLN